MDGRESLRQFQLHWIPVDRDNELVDVSRLAATLRTVLEEVKRSSASANIGQTNMISFKEAAVQMNTIVKTFELDTTNANPRYFRDICGNQVRRSMVEDFITKAGAILGISVLVSRKPAEIPRPNSITFGAAANGIINPKPQSPSSTIPVNVPSPTGSPKQMPRTFSTPSAVPSSLLRGQPAEAPQQAFTAAAQPKQQVLSKDLKLGIFSLSLSLSLFSRL